jgi:hypothetical protein
MKFATYRLLFDNKDNVADRRNMDLRRMREQGSGENLYDLYSSSKVIWGIKSRRRWAGHVTRMEDRRGM